MSEQVEEKPEAAALLPPDKKNADRDLFDRVFERMTPTGPNAMRAGAELIRRRRLCFTVDGASCAPDVFVDDSGEYYDFELTVQSLSSKEEIESLNGITEPGQVPWALAKASLYAVNGKPLPRDDTKIDFLWEALGMQGRQVVMLAFNQLGSASAAALGKFQRSVTVA